MVCLLRAATEQSSLEQTQDRVSSCSEERFAEEYTTSEGIQMWKECIA
jgi:hypothetical protein